MAAKTKPPKKPLAQRVQGKSPAAQALLKRALRDPGLRSKLPTSVLQKADPKLAASRALTIRQKAPIAPGSTVSEGDLARESKAALAVKYGPQERQLQSDVATAQQRQTDVGGFYDEYVNRLVQNQRDVANVQQQAATSLQGIGAGITGLGASGLQSLQSQADQSAAQRGTTAGDLTGLASNATATRQALLGSFQAQQALTGALEGVTASNLANVIAPAQKLRAVAQEGNKVTKARQDILDLATEKGQQDYLYRAQRRTEEGKNVLAAKIGGVDIAAKKATTAKTIAETAKTKADTDYFNQHGYYPGQKPKPPSASEKKTQAELDYFNAHGYWPPTGPPKKGGKDGKGPDWLPKGQAGTGLSQLPSLKRYAVKAKTGVKFKPTGKEKGPGTKLDRTAAGIKIQDSVAAPAHPILLTAALDAAYDGHLSPPTVKALIDAGYKPSEVARTLGVPTAGQTKAANRATPRQRHGGAAGR